MGENKNMDSLKELKILASVLLSRTKVMDRLGQSYDGDRNIYDLFGYPKTLTFSHFYNRYKRQDIAKRVVDTYPDCCWRIPPSISENSNEQTDFEKSWEVLVKKKSIYHYLHRFDRILGIGKFGVLLIGFNDKKKLNLPVTKANDILYLRPFMECNVTIKTWVEDINNERYGLPLIYTLKSGIPSGGTSDVDVHYTRVLHVCDGATEDDINGTPRLEPVYNRLQDIELIAGGSAEMFFRGAFPGIAFEMDKDAQIIDATALEDEIEDYIHGMKRYLKLQGIKANSLPPQAIDPTNHLKVQIDLVSACTSIPKRILVGSERGELASTQDSSFWDDCVEERRTNFDTIKIVRPFVDKLVEVGVLPEPSEEYTVNWPPLHVQSEKERAEIAERWATALGKYVSAIGSDLVIPEPIFLSKYFGFTQEELDKVANYVGKSLQEELAEIRAENEPEQGGVAIGGQGQARTTTETPGVPKKKRITK